MALVSLLRVGRRHVKALLKKIAAMPIKGTLLPLVASFCLGVLVTTLTFETRREDYIMSEGVNEALHWRPDKDHSMVAYGGPKAFFSWLFGIKHVHDEGEGKGSQGSYTHSPEKTVMDYKTMHVHEGNDSVADQLSRTVRVLCWIMTQPKNHQKKAIHVKATWGKRCNILLFMSTADDESLPAVNLHITEGRNELWNKTKAAFKYVYENYYDAADWFMKADDDTYVVVENLRHLVKDVDPKTPIWFGCNFKKFSKQGYMSGGADESLPAVNLHITEGRNELWNKTKAAFKYVYQNYYDAADWFMKADDDTYVVVENLRHLVKDVDPKTPIWFGCNFKKFSKQGYMSGGAGYVLSKEALRKFVVEAMPNPSLCRADGHGAEDAEL
ncbi:unnamed protein product, partial [Notodromas monacha]